MVGTTRTQIPLGGDCDLLIGIPSILIASSTNARGLGTWLSFASFTAALQRVIGAGTTGILC